MAPEGHGHGEAVLMSKLTSKLPCPTVGIVASNVKMLTRTTLTSRTGCAPVRIGWGSPEAIGPQWHSDCSRTTSESRVQTRSRRRVA